MAMHLIASKVPWVRMSCVWKKLSPAGHRYDPASAAHLATRLAGFKNDIPNTRTDTRSYVLALYAGETAR